MSAAPVSEPDFAALTIRQLLALYDAHAAAADAYLSILAQPRAEGAVYGLIEGFFDACNDHKQAIARHVEGRSPASPAEREAKGEILVQWNLACGGWRDLVAVVRENFEGPGI